MGKLPFCYLGIPISSQRLKVADCDILTEKILLKIRVWGSRNLSYTTRMVLVNVVLLNLHLYWAFIFVIPKSIIKRIIGIYRKFLWDGKAVYNRSPPMAWDTMCKKKSEGRLGIRDCEKWNLVAIGKLVWDVPSKADKLWIH